MRYRSTRGEGPPVGFREALFAGLAPDGGLYLPETLPTPREGFFEGLEGRTLGALGAELLAPFTAGDLSRESLERVITEALDFPLPLTPLADGAFLLELFHGPTLAFKDVAARFMARAMTALLRPSDRPLTVLVATSGDTGGAVAHAFCGLERVQVVILYPQGQVSDLQESQLTTLGGNVTAAAVAGTFDHCQGLVKEAFSDPELRRRLFLTSANSINIGRLLPQMLYYLWAVAQLASGVPAPLFVVPSGNFGNLTAGLLAHRLGLPAAGFVAATNVNDVVPQYLASGVFEPRDAVATLSNAMDVGRPSNFERILHLFGGSLEAVRRQIQGFAYDDAATRRAIRQVHEATGKFLDPHTAVGYLALGDALATLPGPVTPILLATAHPAKFPEVVEPLIGEELPLPPALARCRERSRESVDLAPRLADLRRLLLRLGT